MTLSRILLSEFQLEMADTRRALERVPADRLDWSPTLCGPSADERPA